MLETAVVTVIATVIAIAITAFDPCMTLLKGLLAEAYPPDLCRAFARGTAAAAPGEAWVRQNDQP